MVDLLLIDTGGTGNPEDLRPSSAPTGFSVAPRAPEEDTETSPLLDLLNMLRDRLFGGFGTGGVPDDPAPPNTFERPGLNDRFGRPDNPGGAFGGRLPNLGGRDGQQFPPPSPLLPPPPKNQGLELIGTVIPEPLNEPESPMTALRKALRGGDLRELLSSVANRGRNRRGGGGGLRGGGGIISSPL